MNINGLPNEVYSFTLKAKLFNYMRNIILTFILCFIGLVNSAQTLTVSPKILIGSGSNSGGQDFSIIVNYTTTSLTDTNYFKWRILKYNPPTAWLMSFCDPINCVAKIAVDSTGIFYIAKGKLGQMHITYTFNNTPGNDTLRVLVQSILNPAVADTFVLIANSWKTGIKESSISHEINIYPNPVKDLLSIKCASPINSTIDIYNIIGVKVKSFLNDGNLSNLNISDLKNGMYILRITSGNTIYSKTFNKVD